MKNTVGGVPLANNISLCNTFYMEDKTTLSRLHKPVNPIHASISIGCVIIVILFILALVNKQTTQPSRTPQALLTPIPTPISQIFASPDLGISFQYSSGIRAGEVGNRIYLYFPPEKPRVHDYYPGQANYYIDVLQKLPQDSLSDAIKQQFLYMYSDQCRAFLSDFATDKNIHPAYQQMVITVSPLLGDLSDSRTRYCPPYTYTGSGIVYFLYDPAHPRRFAFVHIGQDNWGAGDSAVQKGGHTWDQTITFTDIP